jgi:hypothetical protein
LLNDEQNFIYDNAKHLAADWQHELIIQTDVFAAHVLLFGQDSNIERRLAGAQ